MKTLPPSWLPLLAAAAGDVFDLADALGTNVLTVERWASGAAKPRRASLLVIHAFCVAHRVAMPAFEPIAPILPEIQAHGGLKRVARLLGVPYCRVVAVARDRERAQWVLAALANRTSDAARAESSQGI